MTLSPNEILIDVTYFTLQFIYQSSSSILPVFVSSLLVMQSFATSVTVEGASTVDFGSTWGWRAASLITHSDPSKSGTLCRPVHRSTLVPGWDPDVGRSWKKNNTDNGCFWGWNNMLAGDRWREVLDRFVFCAAKHCYSVGKEKSIHHFRLSWWKCDDVNGSSRSTVFLWKVALFLSFCLIYVVLFPENCCHLNNKSKRHQEKLF